MQNEIWTPVVIKHHGEQFEKDVYQNYEVSNMCRIRSTVTYNVIWDNERDVGSLSGDGVKRKLRRHRVCLASFYPNKIPDNINEYDCDHIDGNHDNMVLSNLQWLSKSDHVKKTMVQTKGTRKSQVEKIGKKVKVVAVKGTGDIKLIGTVYGSTHCAARELQLNKSSIGHSATNGLWAGKSYKFEYVTQPLLENEIFVTLGNYEISNRGRIKMINGKITVGRNMGEIKYRATRIKLQGDNKERHYYMHILVWIAHNGPIPKGFKVMHNDTYHTLDSEGKQRNWLEDLSLGTQSENIQSYHDNRKDLKRVRCIDTGIEYSSTGRAGREMGLDSGNIGRVCNKKYKTTGGKRFEYC